VASNGILVLKLKGKSETRAQHGDLISILPLFIESRLKKVIELCSDTSNLPLCVCVCEWGEGGECMNVNI
jgi:hypothetical protein